MTIKAPNFTRTWHPVAHKDVIKTLDMILEEAGVGVVSETYSVKNGGDNLFTIDSRTRELALICDDYCN